MLENLKFSDDREVTAKFHRMSHSCYSSLLVMITRQAKREGVEVRLVHPAYTSIIGRLKYLPQYAISIHQAAAMVIGRRGVGYEQEKVPQKLVSLCAKGKGRQSRLNTWSASKSLTTENNGQL